MKCKIILCIKYILNFLALILTIFFVFTSISSIVHITKNSSNSELFIIFVLNVLFYFILEPLHELGHYCVAKYFIKKKNANVQLCLSRNKTNCSNWNVFSIREYIIILLFGSTFKIIFCIIGILLFGLYKNYLFVKAFLFTIFMEVAANYQSIISSDMKSLFYTLENNKIPDNEDTNMSTIKTDFFIRKIYPWLLGPTFFIIHKITLLL